MAAKKTDERVNQIANTLRSLYGKDVRVRFGDHSFVHVLEGVRMVTMAELTNKPDAVMQPTGRNQTPQCFALVFKGQDKLVFVLDHIGTPYITSFGLNIPIGDIRVSIGSAA